MVAAWSQLAIATTTRLPRRNGNNSLQVHAAPLRATAAAVGARRMFYGVGAGVAQKLVTRGPMFLASEVCSQAASQFAEIHK